MISETSHPVHAPSAAQNAGDLDVASFVADRVAEHHLLAGARISRLRELASEAAEANADVAELAAMDQKIAFFCNDLPECCRREESMVFPMLLRLHSQTRISQCKAGMIAARLRFMVAEQNALLSSLAEVIEIIGRNLSPAGPCESCHQLLQAAKSFQSDLIAHIRREQVELFEWAVAREAALAQRK
jgi:iron-sulfur cluster repair protein YtfE (RIC family)